MKTPPEFRPTIFLDTNALHYMNTYLQWAKNKKLPPFQEGIDFEQARDVLRDHMPNGIANMLLQGAKALSFLQEQVSQHEAAIYTSQFAKAEVIFGVLEGQAHARMAHGGFPYRMRQRAGILSELVSMYLELKDYQQVIREWDDFLNSLKEKENITILYVEGKEDFSQIAKLAEFLQSRIFMDVVDSWMYACALTTQSERVITQDKYFRQVINKLHNPQKDVGWQQLHNELKDLLKTMLPGEPTLPNVEKLPQSLPKPW